MLSLIYNLRTFQIVESPSQWIAFWVNRLGELAFLWIGGMNMNFEMNFRIAQLVLLIALWLPDWKWIDSNRIRESNSPKNARKASELVTVG